MKIENGVTKFSVHVRSDHRQAIQLYENLEFSQVGICHRHYKIASEWIDVILMELVV
jgi:RimJ/RimL family protein N-acetyltransferase